MEELKRCPFCGGEGTHQIGDMVNPLTVYCLSCEIAIPTDVWQQRVESKKDIEEANLKESQELEQMS